MALYLASLVEDTLLVEIRGKVQSCLAFESPTRQKSVFHLVSVDRGPHCKRNEGGFRENVMKAQTRIRQRAIAK